MDMAQTPPLSPEIMVCHTLRAATDSNPEVLRKAEAQLNEWSMQPGFFLTITRICLVDVGSMDPAIAQQLDVNTRWMAVVYLKNGVNRLWRRPTAKELPPQEKQQIRDLLLVHFAKEPIPQISVQIASVVARIARYDCPREWPMLLPELLKRLQDFAEGPGCEQFDSGEEQRVLLTLYHVVKALASRRLMAEKRVFEELTVNIYDFIHKLWNSHCTLFFHQLKEAPALAKASLEKAVMCTKILRKLTMYGYNKPQNHLNCLHFVEELFERLKLCLNCRYELRQLNADDQLIALLEKLILKQMKILLEFQESHAVAFMRFVPAALQLSFDYVFHVSAYLIFTDNIINFRQFAIHCINLMKGLMSPYFWLKVESSHDENTQNQEARSALEKFFTDERLSYICEKIITHYFVLTQMELDMWLEDPEEFAQEDNFGDTWKYALRPCVETLFVACFASYQPQMAAEVVKYVQKAQQIELTAASDLKDILLKDAIYNAAGQGSLHLFNELDFDSWFSGQLLNELKIESDNFRILRRRIIWLLGEWAGVKFSRDLRPLAYEACLHLLRQTEDMSIRLAASSTLSMLMSDFDFLPLAFVPYLEPSFNSLFVLLREAKECDTKMKVLTIMSSLVEKLSDYIEPHAENLISYLPLLWKESEAFSMLRCAIISTLHQIVKAIRDIPDNMFPFLYSVIALSTDIKQPSFIYLSEEGLTLWLAVVENSTGMTTPLIDLCRNIMPIIEMSLENLRIVLVLIQTYILLDAQAFLSRYGQVFVDYCGRMFDEIRPEAVVLMLKVLETCLKADNAYGLELVRPVLPYIFRLVYKNEDFPMTMGMFLTIMARVLLISQQVFMEVIQELQLPDALETVLDVWITKMPLVTELEKRKLFCLAFLSIFSNNPILLERFPAIMQNISHTLFEVMREDDDVEQNGDDSNAGNTEHAPIKYCDSLAFADECSLDASSYCIMDDFDYKTYHYDRCRQLSLKDPVHKIVLPQYIEWQLSSLRCQLGDESYQQLMRSLCPSVLEKFRMFVNLQTTFEEN